MGVALKLVFHLSATPQPHACLRANSPPLPKRKEEAEHAQYRVYVCVSIVYIYIYIFHTYMYTRISNLREFVLTHIILTPGARGRGVRAAVDDT